MTTSRDFVEKLLLKLLPLDVVANPMFGEYGLYFKAKNFAFVCDETLFIKITGPGTDMARRIAQGSPYPGAKPAFKISAAKLRRTEWLTELIEVTSAALEPPRAKRRRQSQPRPL